MIIVKRWSPSNRILVSSAEERIWLRSISTQKPGEYNRSLHNSQIRWIRPDFKRSECEQFPSILTWFNIIIAELISVKMAVLAAGTVAVAGAVTYGLARPYFKYTVNCHFCDANSKVSNRNKINIDDLVYNRKHK